MNGYNFKKNMFVKVFHLSENPLIVGKVLIDPIKFTLQRSNEIYQCFTNAHTSWLVEKYSTIFSRIDSEYELFHILDYISMWVISTNNDGRLDTLYGRISGDKLTQLELQQEQIHSSIYWAISTYRELYATLQGNGNYIYLKWKIDPKSGDIAYSVVCDVIDSPINIGALFALLQKNYQEISHRVQAILRSLYIKKNKRIEFSIRSDNFLENLYFFDFGGE